MLKVSAVCMRSAIAGFGLLLAVLASAALAASTQTNKHLLLESADGSFSQLTTAEMQDRYGLQTMVIDDPHYHERRSYRGVDLRALLKDQGFKVGEPLILKCIDGYEIPFDTSVLDNPAVQPLLAVADLEPSEGIDFKLFQHGQHTVDFDPFYLVWKADATQVDDATINKLPWPYQLSSIRRAGDFAPQQPPADVQSAVHSGYATYIDNCVRCHSIDNLGGRMGPPLDRNPSMLRVISDEQAQHLIMRVSDFYPGSKMPIFEDKLEVSEVQELIAFLRWRLSQSTPVDVVPEQQAADSRQQ